MKKTLTFATIAFVVLTGAPLVFAQTTDDNIPTENAAGIKRGAVRQEVKDMKDRAREAASTTRNELKQKAEKTREQIQNKRQELQNDLEKRKIELLKKWGEKTIKRLEAAVVRLEKLTMRIESRIAKMKANKIDTTAADASLVIAKEKVAEAKSTLDAAKLAIADIANQADESAVASTTKNILAQNLPKIKEQVRKVTEALKEAHKALVKTITELKGKEGVKKNNATSTAPVNEE
ncbi:MAG: hypothetical protein WC878_07010 [Candidatus Paceibacterota bacterium]|jgi:hypothetical protein